MNTSSDYIPVPRNILPTDGALLTDIRYNCEPVRAAEHMDDDSHIHSCCEIYVNIRGEVSFLVENNVYPVSAGDVIITKPNEFHHCIYQKDILHEHYCLWISSSAEYLPLLNFFFDRKNGEKNRISMDADARAALLESFHCLWTVQNEDRFQAAESLAALFSILGLLSRHRTETGSAQKLPEDLSAVIRYVDVNFHEDCSASALEKRFFISRSTLNRRFRAYLNTSPSRYVEARRMAAAKMMLEQGESVQSTCMHCGFTDYSHFISQFRRRFGITPFQYARQYR